MKKAILLSFLMFASLPLSTTADHGGGLISIDEQHMSENMTSTNDEDLNLSVIVTNNDPEDQWQIKFRGLLKDPETSEYYRGEDGVAEIITVRMTNIGGSSLYNLYPNETKLLELEIETRNMPLGNWSVDIGVEIFTLDTYTDVTSTPVFQIVSPPPAPPPPAPPPQEDVGETPGFGALISMAVLPLAAMFRRRL